MTNGPKRRKQARQGERASERLRVPQPLIKRRIASGRGAMEQPNVTGDGDAELTPIFWVMVALTGVATGLFGDLLMWILFGIQHLAFAYHTGELQTAVEHASNVRRVLSLSIAGVFGGLAWYLLRRYMKYDKSEIDDALWSGDGTLSLRRSLLTSVTSEVVIGLGASMGREAAPKLMGGVSGSILANWSRLTPAQRRLLVACGGGAGLAAVYNVPLGGALFTAEILYGSLALPVILPAVACSWIATATAWLYLPEHATYTDIPSFRFTMTLLVWALLVGPVIGVVSSGYIRLIGWVSHHRSSGRRILVTFPLALCALGFIGIEYPQLFGNGKDMAHSALPRRRGVRSALRAVRTETTRHSTLPRQWWVGGPVHPHPQHRGGTGRPAWNGMVARVARVAGRCIRNGRGRRNDRGVYASPTHGPSSCTRTDSQRISDHGPDDGRSRYLHRSCALCRRLLDLLGSAVSRVTGDRILSELSCSAGRPEVHTLFADSGGEAATRNAAEEQTTVVATTPPKLGRLQYCGYRAMSEWRSLHPLLGDRHFCDAY